MELSPSLQLQYVLRYVHMQLQSKAYSGNILTLPFPASLRPSPSPQPQASYSHCSHYSHYSHLQAADTPPGPLLGGQREVDSVSSRLTGPYLE